MLWTTLLLLVPSSAACTTPNGTECLDPDQCEGGVCIQLPENEQGARGICSLMCLSDADCFPNEDCRPIEGAASYCFQRCRTADDCLDDFICRSVTHAEKETYCLVNPL